MFSPALYDRQKERKALEIAPDDLAVFFIGRLSEEKNPDVFVEVARRLQHEKKAQNIKFFMVGDGKMRPRVERQIKDAKLENFKDLGYRSDIASLLAAADVFALPSAIEGFPLSILEAMAMDVAVVASDVGTVGDVIEDGIDGFIVVPGSAEGIERVVQRLSKDTKLLDNVKRQAKQKLTKNYSNHILKANYTKLYKGESQ
jgi:glycosyltransferase involved in cell wall biosynthesis